MNRNKSMVVKEVDCGCQARGQCLSGRASTSTILGVPWTRSRRQVVDYYDDSKWIFSKFPTPLLLVRRQTTRDGRWPSPLMIRRSGLAEYHAACALVFSAYTGGTENTKHCQRMDIAISSIASLSAYALTCAHNVSIHPLHYLEQQEQVKYNK